MADEHDQDQKTEQPTEKRLTEAFERGQFAKTPELTVVFVVAALLAVLGFTAQSAARDIAEYAVGMFTHFALLPVARDTIGTQISELVFTTARVVAPVLVACVVAVLLAGGLQSGFRLSPKVAAFKPESLDIVAGFGRLFNKSVFAKTGIDLLKLLAIGFALWVGARGLASDPMFSAPVEAAYLGTFLNHATAEFLGRLLLSLGLVAAASYGYEKFKISRDRKSTRLNSSHTDISRMPSSA